MPALVLGDGLEQRQGLVARSQGGARLKQNLAI